MKKKLVMLLTTVMIGSAMLAGCGGNKDAANGTDTGAATEESADAAATEGAAEEDAAEETEETEGAGGASGPITICSREDGCTGRDQKYDLHHLFFYLIHIISSLFAFLNRQISQ